MQIQTSRNFDFVKLKDNQRKAFKKASTENLDNVMDQLKQNIISGRHIEEPLSDMTRSVRLIRGIPHTKPLIATGKLLQGMKKTKSGISVKRYGIMQDEGYLVNDGKEHAFFAPNKRAKAKKLFKISPGTEVPARPWIVYDPKPREIDKIFRSLMNALRIPLRIIKTKEFTL